MWEKMWEITCFRHKNPIYHIYCWKDSIPAPGTTKTNFYIPMAGSTSARWQVGRSLPGMVGCGVDNPRPPSFRDFFHTNAWLTWGGWQVWQNG